MTNNKKRTAEAFRSVIDSLDNDTISPLKAREKNRAALGLIKLELTHMRYLEQRGEKPELDFFKDAK